MQALRLAQRIVPEPLKRIVRRAAALTLLADAGSSRRLTRALLFNGRPSVNTVEVRLRPLKGAAIRLRPRSSDLDVLWDTFVGRYHLPPRPLSMRELTSIWDLGCSIGLTMAHFAVLFPNAVVVGVEMDSENVSLCRVNTGAWKSRCTVIEGAVWSTGGTIAYEWEAGNELAARVIQPVMPRDSENVRTAPALPLNDLVERLHCDRIDYLKIDIEGAEREILRVNTDWSHHVEAMKVEVHPPYSVDECGRDVEKLGFTAEIDRRHWSTVIGIRR
jgi:FkbM family methyltransferase